MALTEQQKQAATRIRQQGGTVKQAADILMVSTQELKNYLHRAGIAQTQADADGLWCAWCGQRIDASTLCASLVVSHLHQGVCYVYSFFVCWREAGFGY